LEEIRRVEFDADKGTAKSRRLIVELRNDSSRLETLVNRLTERVETREREDQCLGEQVAVLERERVRVRAELLTVQSRLETPQQEGSNPNRRTEPVAATALAAAPMSSLPTTPAARPLLFDTDSSLAEAGMVVPLASLERLEAWVKGEVDTLRGEAKRARHRAGQAEAKLAEAFAASSRRLDAIGEHVQLNWETVQGLQGQVSFQESQTSSLILHGSPMTAHRSPCTPGGGSLMSSRASATPPRSFSVRGTPAPPLGSIASIGSPVIGASSFSFLPGASPAAAGGKLLLPESVLRQVDERVDQILAAKEERAEQVRAAVTESLLLTGDLRESFEAGIAEQTTRLERVETAVAAVQAAFEGGEDPGETVPWEGEVAMLRGELELLHLDLDRKFLEVASSEETGKRLEGLEAAIAIEAEETAAIRAEAIPALQMAVSGMVAENSLRLGELEGRLDEGLDAMQKTSLQVEREAVERILACENHLAEPWGGPREVRESGGSSGGVSDGGEEGQEAAVPSSEARAVAGLSAQCHANAEFANEVYRQAQHTARLLEARYEELAGLIEGLSLELAELPAPTTLAEPPPPASPRMRARSDSKGSATSHDSLEVQMDSVGRVVARLVDAESMERIAAVQCLEARFAEGLSRVEASVNALRARARGSIRQVERGVVQFARAVAESGIGSTVDVSTPQRSQASTRNLNDSADPGASRSASSRAAGSPPGDGGAV